mgnify:CR=1 FL=1
MLRAREPPAQTDALAPQRVGPRLRDLGAGVREDRGGDDPDNGFTTLAATPGSMSTPMDSSGTTAADTIFGGLGNDELYGSPTTTGSR